MTQTLLVTGASGKLGRKTVELLLDKGAAPASIIATTRDPSKLEDLAAKGVQVRAADFDDAASLPAAFAGADRMAIISTDVLGEPDIDPQAAAVTASEVSEAIAIPADVSQAGEMRDVAAKTILAFGGIDVLVNNAGTMPLALFSDHAEAMDRWHQAFDVNIKGTLNGIAAVHDQMIAQGRGHVVNISSIYGNHPTYGTGVYGATKAAINFMSDSLRVEARGKIKVTVVKPAGVSGTGLADTVVNRAGVKGILGHNFDDYMALRDDRVAGRLGPESSDPASSGYLMLDPAEVAASVVHVIDQPDGVSIGEITVRATGEHFIL